MSAHTTNYFNTFIEVADDCPAGTAEVPPGKSGTRSVARIQYDLISENPYRYTSDEVLFLVHAEKNQVSPANYEAARNAFFSKGQPCMRSSPLAKRYGWGIHCNAEGRIALCATESTEYHEFVNKAGVKHIKAMKSKRT